MIGVIVILPMVPADAKGQYIPFKRPLQGLPALHVDLSAGNEIRELSKAAGNVATLVLPAIVNSAETTDALLAVLPGSSTEEVVLVNTHTDGPNLIEENEGAWECSRSPNGCRGSRCQNARVRSRCTSLPAISPPA